MEDEVARKIRSRIRSREVETLTSMVPVVSSVPYWRAKDDETSVPDGVNDAHWNHWSVRACPGAAVTTGRLLGSAVVPVKVAPPSPDTLSTILLLQAPGVLTPVYRLFPVTGLTPAGTHPLDSFESLLM